MAVDLVKKGKCRHCGTPTKFHWSNVCDKCAESMAWWI